MKNIFFIPSHSKRSIILSELQVFFSPLTRKKQSTTKAYFKTISPPNRLFLEITRGYMYAFHVSLNIFALVITKFSSPCPKKKTHKIVVNNIQKKNYHVFLIVGSLPPSKKKKKILCANPRSKKPLESF